MNGKEHRNFSEDMVWNPGDETRIIPKEMDGNRKISSTFIREELSRGNMHKVTELLGRNFFVAGTVEHGRGMGHKKFFPTTNLVPDRQKLMPPNGVYITKSRFDDAEYAGITNVRVTNLPLEKAFWVWRLIFLTVTGIYTVRTVLLIFTDSFVQKRNSLPLRL